MEYNEKPKEEWSNFPKVKRPMEAERSQRTLKETKTARERHKTNYTKDKFCIIEGGKNTKGNHILCLIIKYL